MKRLVSIALLGLLTLTACGAQGEATGQASSVAAPELSDGMTVTVESVSSGNAFTAVFENGAKRQVKLINTAAPSNANVALSGSCLIEESTNALKEQLPEGTQVTLSFDENQRGSTGSIEAAVNIGDRQINSEMVRKGLLATTYATTQDKFYPGISLAQNEAAAEGIGLYSPDLECTIPAAINRQRAAVEDARTWEVAEEDHLRESERQQVYKDASALYTELSSQAKYPSNWMGSIVTLSSVDQQLKDFRNLLGKDYYGTNGKSENQKEKASAAATPVRPGS